MEEQKSEGKKARGETAVVPADAVVKKAARKKAPAKKAASKKAASKKTAAKKSAAKKTTAKKAAPKRTTAKKTSPKKGAAKKTTAKKTTAKKSAAKRKVAPKRHVAKGPKTPTRRGTPEVRERDLISFGLEDGTNPAMPAEVHAPDLLDFEQTEEMVSDLSEDELRDLVVETLEAIENFGIADQPAGRRAAYGDIIAGTETKQLRDGLLAKDPRNSSCALVVRALWRFLGATDAKLLDRFVISKPFEYVCQFAKNCGAYTNVKVGDEEFQPKRGDVLVLQKGNRQHIFTLVEVDEDTFTSIDGGEPSHTLDDGTCNGIHKMVRSFHRDTFCFGTDDRPVTGWIDVSKLKFSVPRIALRRGMEESAEA